MFEPFTSPKSSRYNTPDQYLKKISNEPLNNKKKKINKKQKNYNINLSPDLNIKDSLSIKESSNTEQNSDIDFLNQKIIAQKNNISYLKSRLKNYKNSQNEILRLKQELAKLEAAIKGKNKIISEFQKLTEITKTKFELYISKAHNQLKEYNRKSNNYPNLEKENIKLNEKLVALNNENKSLKQKYQEIEDKNKIELDNAKNDINSLKNNYEDIINENNNLKTENNKSIKEIENLRRKLLAQEKYEAELEEIKKKYFFLENQINKKENNIKNLKKINEVLENKIKTIDDKYKQLLNEQRNLKGKESQFQNMCQEYKISIQKLNRNNNFSPRMDKGQYIIRGHSKNYNTDYSYSSRNKNNNIILNKKKDRIFYKHNNHNNIIGNINSSKNLLKENENTFNYNNIKNLRGNSNFSSYRLNILTQNNNNYEFNSKNKGKINLITNRNDYIKRSNEFLDKSFGYSNYLLDNLKNKISGIHFNKGY